MVHGLVIRLFSTPPPIDPVLLLTRQSGVMFIEGPQIDTLYALLHHAKLIEETQVAKSYALIEPFTTLHEHLYY